MTETVQPKRSVRFAAISLALVHVVLLLAVFVVIGRTLFEGDSIENHIPVGGLSGIVAVFLLVVVATGRMGWKIPLLLVIMHIVQHVLPSLDAVRWLHPLNASLMLLLGFWYWLDLRRRPRAPAAPPAAEPSADSA